MPTVPVFKMTGAKDGELEVDAALLGGRVRPKLLKQAVVAYRDHLRRRSARTKGKADVAGSTRKLYRQKGTGNARMGQVRTPIRKGGGRTFGKWRPTRITEFPKKMRRLARDNAVLARIQGGDALVIDDLHCEQIKTKAIASMLLAVGVVRGCVLAMHDRDRNVLLSARNIAGTDVRVVDDMNAYDVLRRNKLVFSKPAFERLLAHASGRNGTGT